MSSDRAGDAGRLRRPVFFRPRLDLHIATRPAMGLSELCIRRPVLTTLVTATFIVFGIFAYRLLPVSALPAVDFPTITVTATLPGASAENMATAVAAPIERQMSTIS